MRRRYNHQRQPFTNVRRSGHTHWIQRQGQYWDGFQFLDPRQHDWATFARTYTLTGARIALKALQKRCPDVVLVSLEGSPALPDEGVTSSCWPSCLESLPLRQPP